MAAALVSLGANLGDRAATLEYAAAALGDRPGVRVAARSGWHETAPVGGPEGQPAFLNGALLVETTLSPQALLHALQAVEQEAGRQRQTRWGARTLDLDLLLYDQQIIEEEGLTLPHPRMAYRRFVLEPAAEAAPAMRHPQIGWTIHGLREHLNTAPNYLALVGPPGTDTARLAEQAAERTGSVFFTDSHGWPSWAPQRETDELGSDPQIASLSAQVAGIERALALAPQGVISDFWIEQSLLRLQFQRASSEVFLRSPDGASLMASAPAAKLVVYWDAEHSRPRSGSAPDFADVEQGERIAMALHAQATRPQRGSFLNLRGASFDHALAEVGAAMLAMR